MPFLPRHDHPHGPQDGSTLISSDQPPLSSQVWNPNWMSAVQTKDYQADGMCSRQPQRSPVQPHEMQAGVSVSKQHHLHLLDALITQWTRFHSWLLNGQLVFIPPLTAANVGMGTEGIWKGNWLISNQLGSKGEEREETSVLCLLCK